jgi:hypothetical protein
METPIVVALHLACDASHSGSKSRAGVPRLAGIDPGE